MFAAKRILITGGTGTWGHELTRQCLQKNATEVVIFSRNESLQVAMKQEFSKYKSRISFILGDIRDQNAILEACKGINIVFHAAALKHVTKCEQQPREAYQTNITGTMNLIEACIYNNVDTCINISTDKVCHASCFYGHTKAIAEALITEANNRTEHTDFFSVRSGNIFGSSGSVIDIWKKQLENFNEIGITNPEMTRFFISIRKAVHLTLKAMELSDRGEVFVFKMPAFSVGQLSQQFKESYGIKGTKIVKIGPLTGERNEEFLFTQYETWRMTQTRQFFIVYPTISIITTDYPEFGNFKKYIPGNGYSSVINRGTKAELAGLFKGI